MSSGRRSRLYDYKNYAVIACMHACKWFPVTVLCCCLFAVNVALCGQYGMFLLFGYSAMMACFGFVGCSSRPNDEYSLNPVRVDDMGLVCGYPVVAGVKFMDGMRRLILEGNHTNGSEVGDGRTGIGGNCPKRENL